MAELMGVVSAGAGLVSVAIQLTQCAMKLKSFYERARDIRTSLADLTHELETIALTLRDLERHRQNERHDASLLERCARRCEEIANQISLLVDKLESRINKFNLAGKAYATLKQPEVAELMKEMEQAKSSIILALQMYSLSVQSSRDEVQRAEIERLRADNAAVQAAILNQVRLLALTAASSEDRYPCRASTGRIQAIGDIRAASSNSEDDVEEVIPVRSQHRKAMRRQRQSAEGVHIRVSFGWSITGRIWDIAFKRSQGSMSWSLTTWNVMPYDSLIFNACVSGDTNAVRDLIWNGSASLLDVWPSGRNLLDLAAGQGHLDLCRFLLREGVFANFDGLLQSALDEFASYRPGRSPPWKHCEMYKLFIEEFSMDVEFDDCSTRNVIKFCPTAECMRIVKDNQPVPYSSRSQHTRFEDMIRIVDFHAMADPQILLELAGESCTTQDLARFRSRDGATALHHVAKGLTMSCEVMQNRFMASEATAMFCSWTNLLEDLIRMGADPSAIMSGQTPMLYAFDMLTYDVGFEGHKTAFSIASTAFLRHWTGALRRAGIDLIAYGIEENNALERWDPPIHLGDTYITPCRFIYGDRPEDWSVEIISHRTTPIFELQALPGSWDFYGSPTRRISWRPSQDEQEEGIWILNREIVLQSEPWDIRSKLEAAEGEYFDELLQQHQDDHGPIVLRCRSRNLSHRLRPRSCSQPPSTGRREYAHWEGLENRVQPWIKCHLCPLDHKWRLACNDSGHGYRLRDCLTDALTSELDVQDTWVGVGLVS